MATKAASPAALVVAVVMLLSYTSVVQGNKPTLSLCQSVPQTGLPFLNSKGNVTLVSLSKATNKLCQQQISKLEMLSGYFKRIGMDNVKFISIIEKEEDEIVKNFQSKVGIPVFEDSTAKLMFSALGGKRNDIFIFDTCGRLTFYIPFPMSMINSRQKTVESAVVATYTTEICGFPCRNEDKELTETNEEDKNKFEGENLSSQEQAKNVLKETSTTTDTEVKKESGGFFQSILKVWSFVKSAIIEQPKEVSNETEPNEICKKVNDSCHHWPKRRIENAEHCCYNKSYSKLHKRKCHYFTEKRCEKIKYFLICCAPKNCLTSKQL